jgi:hypothetical protein
MDLLLNDACIFTLYTVYGETYWNTLQAVRMLSVHRVFRCVQIYWSCGMSTVSTVAICGRGPASKQLTSVVSQCVKLMPLFFFVRLNHGLRWLLSASTRNLHHLSHFGKQTHILKTKKLSPSKEMLSWVNPFSMACIQ